MGAHTMGVRITAASTTATPIIGMGPPRAIIIMRWRAVTTTPLAITMRRRPVTITTRRRTTTATIIGADRT